MNRRTISLCMIVKDEEQHIERCLASSASHVDEIIIADTGSTDGTLDIVKRYGAKVVPFQWVDDFAAARNHALQQATSDYILVLDADEYLDDSTDLQKDLESGSDAYTLKFLNYTTSGTVIQHAAVRLFKNRLGLEYFGRIHEHLNLEQLGVSVTNAKTLIHHDGYLRETYEHKGKHERNLKLLLKAVEENPSGYNLFNLGTQYRQNGQHAEAVNAYKRAYPLSKERVHVCALLFNMVSSLRELKQYDDALRVIHDAIAGFPRYTDFHYLRGNIYEESGFLPDAMECYKKCLELGDVKMEVTYQAYEGMGSYLAHYRLAETYARMGSKTEALDQAILAIGANPRYLPSMHLYLRLQLEAHIPLDQAYDSMKKVYAISSLEALQGAVSVLYTLRHPLLQRLLTEYQRPAEAPVLATAKLYDRHYEEAGTLWKGLDALPQLSVSDVILNAILLQDESLLETTRPAANFSKREWKVIKQVVTGEGSSDVLTGELEELFLTLCRHVIVLQEYEVFERLSGLLVKGSVKARIELAKELIAYQFTDVAFDLLADLYEQQPNHVEVLVLLGDVCLDLQRWSDALALYMRAWELRSDYEVLYRVYRYYERTGDGQGMQQVRTELQRLFPLSLGAV